MNLILTHLEQSQTSFLINEVYKTKIVVFKMSLKHTQENYYYIRIIKSIKKELAYIKRYYPYTSLILVALLPIKQNIVGQSIINIISPHKYRQKKTKFYIYMQFLYNLDETVCCELITHFKYCAKINERYINNESSRLHYA